MRMHARYVGKVEQVHVQGYNRATNQWIGHTSQLKTLNFTDAALPAPDGIKPWPAVIWMSWSPGSGQIVSQAKGFRSNVELGVKNII